MPSRTQPPQVVASILANKADWDSSSDFN
jgi:hypothetical protein